MKAKKANSYKKGGTIDPPKEDTKSTGNKVNTVSNVGSKEALDRAGVTTRTQGGRTSVRAVNIATPPKPEPKNESPAPSVDKKTSGGKSSGGDKVKSSQSKSSVKTPFGQKKYRTKMLGPNKGSMVAKKRLIKGGGGVNARQTSRGRR